MSDTSLDISAEFDAIMEQRPGSDRVRMACEMFDLARKLAVADIRAGDPTISDERLRVRLLERFYADDLSEAQLAYFASAL